ncbi:MAG TPA: Txe/YoeB family addiction module toxin [Bryobacteraceae bacterium]
MSRVERTAIFQRQFLDDFRYWVKADRNTALRIFDLIDATLRDPFVGIGKPEPLRHEFAGCWSRRITPAHRLIYRVTLEQIDFLQARYHY